MILFIYRILINFVLIFSPFIFLIRILKKKEDIKRFKEKLCFFSKRKIKNKLIWFHGASVGEISSIVPIVLKLEKNNNIDQILITSSTLSSSNILNQFKFKKTIHQFFPIDTNQMSKKFLKLFNLNLKKFINFFLFLHFLQNLTILKPL